MASPVVTPMTAPAYRQPTPAPAATPDARGRGGRSAHRGDLRSHDSPCRRHRARGRLGSQRAGRNHAAAIRPPRGQPPSRRPHHARSPAQPLSQTSRASPPCSPPKTPCPPSAWTWIAPRTSSRSNGRGRATTSSRTRSAPKSGSTPSTTATSLPSDEWGFGVVTGLVGPPAGRRQADRANRVPGAAPARRQAAQRDARAGRLRLDGERQPRRHRARRCGGHPPEPAPPGPHRGRPLHRNTMVLHEPDGNRSPGF